MAEYLLQGFGIYSRRNGKHTIFVKTTIGYQDMHVQMKSKEVTEGLCGDNRTRDRLFVANTGCVKSLQSLPATAVEIRK